MNGRPDEILVAAGRGGDEKACAELVRRHLERVFAVCLAILGNREDAEDAVQEVFVKGIASLHTLRRDGQFGAWITQIARNRSRDLLRGRQRRPEQSLTDRVAARAATPPDEFSDLRDAIARLPVQHRYPLLLFYYDGKSTRKLAEALDLSEGGACVRLYRARLALRTLLEEEAVSHD